MDSLLDGIITSSENHKPSKQHFHRNTSSLKFDDRIDLAPDIFFEPVGKTTNGLSDNTELHSSVWSEDSVLNFCNLINSVIDNNYLDESTDQHQDIMNAAVQYMQNFGDLSSIYSNIQSGLSRIRVK